MEEKNIILMHGDHPVALIRFNARRPVIIDRVMDRERMPIGMNDTIDSFQQWFRGRCISADRREYEYLMQHYGLDDIDEFAGLDYCDNMTDGYWLAEEDEIRSGLRFQDISHRWNKQWGISGYSLLINRQDRFHDIEDPSFFTSGQKTKAWVQQDGVLYLMIADGTEGYDAFCMVASSEIARHYGIPHAKYRLNREGDICCYNSELITSQIWQEMIPMVQLAKEGVSGDALQTLATRYDFIDDYHKMVVLDYITGRPTRSMDNISVIRDIETMRVVGLSPLYGESQAFCSDYNEAGIYGLTGRRLLDDLNHAAPVYLKIESLPNIDDVLNDVDRIAEELCAVYVLPKSIFSEAIHGLESRMHAFRNIVQRL